MSTAGGDPGRGVGPPVAVALATVLFVALVVAGLGLASLATGRDVIATTGLGPVPGALGVACATLAFGGVLWTSARTARPSFVSVVWVTAASFLAYLFATGAGAAVAKDPAVALGVVGALATGWQGLVVAAAAVVCAWSGIALVRTRAGLPHWPWERDDE